MASAKSGVEVVTSSASTPPSTKASHRRGTDPADDARMTAMTPGFVRRMDRRARDSSAFIRKVDCRIPRPIASGEPPRTRPEDPDRATGPDFRLPPPRRPRINVPAP